MNCMEINKKLIFYIEEDLSSEKKKYVKEHLQKCYKCKHLYNEMYKTLDTIKDKNKVEINPFFYTRLKNKMEDTNKSSFKTVYIPSLVKILQTSVAVFLIAFGVFLGMMMGDSFNNPTMVSENQQIY